MNCFTPLMTEHRIIESMFVLLNHEVKRLNQQSTVDVVFIDALVDFMKSYSDRTHHGKEEGILFTHLATKQLSPELSKIMNELIEEHRRYRRTVEKLILAKERYLKREDASEEIIAYLKGLAILYPVHLEKEDKHFFYPCRDYLTKKDQNNILREFREFDSGMIHAKYQEVIEQLKK
jgi:hemerythrin-like domain-containing protein